MAVGQVGNLGTNQAVGRLEEIAGQLGTPLFDSSGVFTKIDTTTQGAAYSTMTAIIGLQNDIKQLGGEASGGAGAQDNSQLIALLQQQNLVLSEELALSEQQTRALASMLPEIPKYEKGGPVISDGLAQLHKDEWVVPRGGALVEAGGSSNSSSPTQWSLSTIGTATLQRSRTSSTAGSATPRT